MYEEPNKEKEKPDLLKAELWIFIGSIFGAAIFGIIVGGSLVITLLQPYSNLEYQDLNYGFVDVLREDTQALVANQQFLSDQLAMGSYWNTCLAMDQNIIDIRISQDTYQRTHAWIMYCPLMPEER